MLNKKQIKLALATGFLLVISGVVYFMPPKCPGPEKIHIDNLSLRAIYACTPQEQVKGLGEISQEEFAAKADAMVFPFAKKAPRTFWMKGMQFPLDLVWVKGDTVVKIEENAQPPGEGENPQIMRSYPFEIDHVLELRAGDAKRFKIQSGSKVSWY